MPCVDAVVVQDAVWEADVAVDGRYQRDTRQIALSAAAADLRRTLLHERITPATTSRGACRRGRRRRCPWARPAAYPTREARQREPRPGLRPSRADPGLLLALGSRRGPSSLPSTPGCGEGSHPTWRRAPPPPPWDLEDALDGAHVAAAPCGPRLCLPWAACGPGGARGPAGARPASTEQVVDTLAIPRDEDRAYRCWGRPAPCWWRGGRAAVNVPPADGAAMEVHGPAPTCPPGGRWTGP